MRMQEKFSAGKDCLQFPQVTSRNLPAPAVKLHEASNVLLCVSGWLFPNLVTSPFIQYQTT